MHVDVLGAGGHASVVVDVAHRAGAQRVTVWYEHEPDAARFATGTLLRPITDLPPTAPVLLGMGDIQVRRSWRLRFPYLAPPLVDPSAIIGFGVTIGVGSVVMPGTIVNANALIGKDVILNTGCVVEHDCSLGRNTHLSPGVLLAGGATLGEDCHLGTGAIVLPGVAIGDGAVLGAGAVATRHVKGGTTVIGVPAEEHPR